MSKQRVFELIRKEQVVLWVGAGFSKYAGYPLGGELAQKLLNELDTDSRQQYSNSSLADISEAVIRYHGNSRAQLNRILYNTFIERRPSSKSYHEKIAKIPHIKTIVTTNYDRLFENTIKELRVVHSDRDVSLIEDDKPVLFKIHGDPAYNEVVITRNDYYKQIKNNGTLVNAHLTSKISTKSVLFLGYGFEDTNVEILFENVLEHLGNNTNQLFLVAPKLDQVKVRYLERKQITYIDSTAEKFINDLLENINNNISEDLAQKKVKIDTYTSYLKEKKLAIDFRSLPNGYEIKGIRGINGNKLKGNLTFSTEDEKIKQKILGLLSGENFDDLILSNISNLEYKIEDVKFPIGQFSSLKISPKPICSKIDIIFGDNELNDVNLKIYKSIKHLKYVFETSGGDFIITSEGDTNDEEKTTLNFKVKSKDYYRSVNDLLNFYNFLKYLSESKPVKILFENGKDTGFNMIADDDFKSYCDISLEIYTIVKKIEHYYNCRFRNIKEVNDDDINTIEKLSYCIENKPFDIELTEPLLINVFDLSPNSIKELTNLDSDIIIQNEQAEIVKLWDVDLDIGFPTYTIQNATVVNLDNLISGIEKTAIINGGKNLTLSFTKEKPL